ncbi:MAG TPA: radical SAM protein, partial [Bacteroidales bacterium]|nr:radical SAM protein [Bacteroidales bacterium]
HSSDGEVSEIRSALIDNGFLVPENIDENKRAEYLHQSMHRTDMLHLILMPTEACNFRCTYCYESFTRGRMNKETVNGVKELVRSRAKTLSSLHISWFGGEPLLEIDLMEELTRAFQEIAAANDIEYSADISTNGYFLNQDVFERLLSMDIRQYMITIDGVEEVHDSRRFLIGGGRTFSEIMENLKSAKESPEKFDVSIRVNFDESNLKQTEELTDYLKGYFAKDRRFGVLYRPVGRWGGEHDEDIPICSHITANNKMWQFTNDALDKNLAMSSMIEGVIMPTGSVCYAAKPNALVIGSDGQLYKCTTALDADINHVGQLHEDGSMDLDYDKIISWVTSGEETDATCQSCFYRPSCQGNHCPWYRILTGERPCPSEKTNIRKVLNLIWKNSLNF